MRPSLQWPFCCCCLVPKLGLILCDPMDCSPPGSSVHDISQARILERVASPFSRGTSWPEVEPGSPALAGGFFTTEPPGKPYGGRYTWIPLSMHPTASLLWPGGDTTLIVQERSDTEERCQNGGVWRIKDCSTCFEGTPLGGGGEGNGGVTLGGGGEDNGGVTVQVGQEGPLWGGHM